MSNEQPVVPNPPTPPIPPVKDADQELVLKEQFKRELKPISNHANFAIILPDEIKVKEEKKK